MICNDMAKILLITSIYPTGDPKYKGTPVCHYFAKEWMNQGHEVRVVHFDTILPSVFSLVGKLFPAMAKRNMWSVAYFQTDRKKSVKVLDGVKSLYCPVLRPIPHRAIPRRIIEKSFKQACEFLEADGFVPDAIAAHFGGQIVYLPLFKEKYPNAKNCLVLHQDKNGETPLMKYVDLWGFRSKAYLDRFVKDFGDKYRTFLCLSGVPDEFIRKKSKTFPNGIHRFVFVGSLLELKRVDDAIEALHNAFEDGDYTFDIVGDGIEEERLKKLVVSLGDESRVHFHGRLPRNEAQQYVEQADCFIMVSSHEAFGLVYLEAMAKGCIPVATIGQGADGFIINGKNGFLCRAYNVSELTGIIRRLKDMQVADLEKMSSDALETAKELTDSKVAANYVNELLSK